MSGNGETIEDPRRPDAAEPPVVPESAANPFHPGELLAGRFRVMRRLAQGGMGVVYEAMDQKLGRRIAIKCAQAGHEARLTPEARYASEVSHPNICTTFEIHTAETSAGPVDFVTMELIQGTSLAARLHTGPLPEPEATDIALQLCAGLAQAHSHGVIHGDLKPANIILTQTAGQHLRAVITDFGLARAAAQASSAAGGSRGYMAPELFTGAPISVASDIYALGVILHELATGLRPGQNAATDVTTVIQPAGVSPESRTERRRRSRWGSIIRRCLAPDPALRYRSVDQVADALRPPATRRRLLIAAGSVALAALAAFVTWQRATAPPESVGLTVLPLQGGDVAAGFAPNLGDEILTQVSRLDNSRRIAFSAGHSGWFWRSTHRLSVALTLEHGDYILRVDLRDIKSDAPIAAWTGDYTRGLLPYCPVAIAALVSSAFHLPPPRQYATVNQSAAPHYRDGLALLRQSSRIDQAIDNLQLATLLDPDSALNYAALAEARWRKYSLTNDALWLSQATESVRLAELRNRDISEVHSIAAMLDANALRRDAAIARLQRAIELSSASSDPFERLGTIYQIAGQYTEALQAYRRAIAIEPNYFVNHQALASLYYFQASYAEAAAEYQKALRLAPEVPQLHADLATSLQNLGKFEEAEAVLRDALRADSPEIAYRLGHVLLYEGRDRDAIPFLQQAVQGDSENRYAWTYLGIARRRTGNQAGARTAFQHAAELADASVERLPDNGRDRAFLAFLCAQTGESTRARSEAAQAMRLSASNSETLFWAALTYETLDQRAQALEVLASAPRPLLEDMARWPDCSSLTEDPQFQSLLSAARRSPS